MKLEGATLAVFCGSSPGFDPAFLGLARSLGKALGERSIAVVYGGASVGLMGAVADAALTAGGRVVGVIPESLKAREIAHTGLTELHVTVDMHARKAMMMSHAHGFVTLPGGFGTWEEVLEVATWRQIGLHHKPIVIMNHGGYYDPLRAQVETALTAGFIHPVLKTFLYFARDVDDALAYLEAYEPSAEETGKFTPKR